MSRMGIVEQGVVTFTAAEALGARVRVKLAASQSSTPADVDAAGAGAQHIGITEYAVASGELVAVRLRNAPGTRLVTAAGAFAQGATLYGAASGRVDDAVSGTALGKALEAAGAAGDIVGMIDDNGGF